MLAKASSAFFLTSMPRSHFVLWRLPFQSWCIF